LETIIQKYLGKTELNENGQYIIKQSGDAEITINVFQEEKNTRSISVGYKIENIWIPIGYSKRPYSGDAEDDFEEALKESLIHKEVRIRIIHKIVKSLIDNKRGNILKAVFPDLNKIETGKDLLNYASTLYIDNINVLYDTLIILYQNDFLLDLILIENASFLSKLTNIDVNDLHLILKKTIQNGSKIARILENI